MGANDRAVDHQILVVAVCCQRLEHPLPYAGMAPAAETLMHRLPFAIALRQVAPMCAGAQNPQATLMNRRLSEPLRPGSPILPGNKDAILSH